MCRLIGDDSTAHGTFLFNPHSLIAARLLDRDPDAAIDIGWMRKRIGARRSAAPARVRQSVTIAWCTRRRIGLPGLVIDRYGDVAVLQANSAGMDRLTPLVVEALTGLLPLRAVVARNIRPRAGRRGWKSRLRCCPAATPPRSSRRAAFASRSTLSRDKKPAGSSTSGRTATAWPLWRSGARVLDVFCHVGAFGLRCAVAGAAASDPGGQLRSGAGAGAAAAELNGVARDRVVRGGAMRST